MANEGKDDYQPDPVKIEAFEKLKKSIDQAKKRDANSKRNKKNGHENGNGKSKEETEESKAACSIFISFDQWRAKLLEKYNKLCDTIAHYMPHLWASLEFDLSVKNILYIKDIGQPFAGIVLGKPSSLKTVGLEMFRKSKDTHYTDNFTARSFVSHNSGLSEERLQQVDLLPKIRNKCFLTPELAPVFSAKDEDLLALLGIMTRVLDGYGYENDSGAQGHRGYNERTMFTWIGAAVDIPFKVHKLMTTLGPRLYFLRIPGTQNRTDEDYLSQLEHNDFDIKRHSIQTALMDYLNWLEHACPMMERDNKFKSNLKKMPWLNGQASASDYDKIQAQRKAFGHIVKLARLLAPLRGVVPTWHTHDTQGSDYGYTLPTIEEPDRAMQQLANLARGHAMLTGRNYITSEEDLPMIIKVVLSTAPIERVTIFDVLLAHEGVLNVNQITQSLHVSEHTARRTMLELDILGLVERDTLDMICSDGVVRKGFQIRLKDEFQWFLSEEFTSLRQGFKPSKGEELKEQDEPTEEKHPPRRDDILDHVEENTGGISENVVRTYKEEHPHKI